MSSFPPSSPLPGDSAAQLMDATAAPTEFNSAPPPIITTTATSIPLSPSTVPTSSSSSIQPGGFTSGGSPPLIAGFISTGAFAVAVISICVWRKFRRRPDPDSALTRFVDRVLPGRFRRRRVVVEGGQQEGGQGQGQEGNVLQQRRGRQRWRQGSSRGRGRGRSNELSKAKPEIFEAWIKRGEARSATTLKWEAESSVPLSATRLFSTGSSASAAAACVSMISSRVGVGRDSVEVEEEDQEKPVRPQRMPQVTLGSSSSTLQVAVLLQMPSPPPPLPSHTVTEVQNDFSVRGELAIGLFEAPWTREHPSSRECDETTIQ